MPLAVKMKNPDISTTRDHVLDDLLHLPLIQPVRKLRLILISPDDRDETLHHMRKLCHGNIQRLRLFRHF